MTTYQPKSFSSVTAARVREDLIVPKGDYVTIDAEGVIRTFTEDQFHAIYRSVAKTARKREETAPYVKTIPNGSYKPTETVDGIKAPGRSEDGLLRSAGGRFLYVLAQLPEGSVGATKHDLQRWLPKDKASVTGRMTELRYFKFIDYRRDPITSAPCYCATDRGRVAIARVGTIMFTRFGQEVPVIDVEEKS